MDSDVTPFDCIIIGGGAAGLSAAMVLGRAHRSVALVDAGEQSNLASHAAHSVFTRDCIAPVELYAIAREQLGRYPAVVLMDDTATAVERDRLFTVSLASGDRFRGCTLLLAQGVHYELPAVPGLAGLWGKRIFHCPYCDGYEATGQRLLAIGDAEWQDSMCTVLSNFSKDITWVEAAQVERVDERGSAVWALIRGEELVFDRVFVQTHSTRRDRLADSLGCRRTAKDQLEIDADGSTSVPGVYAAGDQSTNAAQVSMAVAGGHTAAVAINLALSREDTATLLARAAQP